MPRPTDACAGPCCASLNKAWDAYEAAIKAHEAAEGLLISHGTTPDVLDAPERPEEPEPRAYWKGDPIFCARCTARIRRALAALDILCAIVEASADGHRDAGDGQAPTGKRSKGASEPSASPTVDQLDRLLGYLLAVQDAYRVVRNWPPRPTGGRKNRGAEARIEAIAWLGVHLDAILRHPGSVRFGRGVLAWHRILEKAASAGPVDERMQGRCPMPSCGRVALRRWEDPGQVKCERCGVVFPLAEYEALCERQLAEVQARREARAS